MTDCRGILRDRTDQRRITMWALEGDSIGELILAVGVSSVTPEPNPLVRIVVRLEDGEVSVDVSKNT